MLRNSFSQNGFLIVKNAIPKKVFLDMQNSVLKTFYKKELFLNNSKNNYRLFSDKVEKYFGNKNLFDTFKFVEPFYHQFVSDGIFKKVLESKKLLKVLYDLLGKDLSHIDDITITLNLPDKGSSKLNYLFKKWHQELWSGSSVSNLLIWTPIFQYDNTNQLEIIKQSHLWGHIPHRDREPISLPKKYKSFFTKLNMGDVLIFHSLLLHRSVPIKKNIKQYNPRLAFPLGVKNFRYIDHNTFLLNKSWKVFSKSELTLIENKLGNFYLSPFRLLGKDC